MSPGARAVNRAAHTPLANAAISIFERARPRVHDQPSHLAWSGASDRQSVFRIVFFWCRPRSLLQFLEQAVQAMDTDARQSAWLPAVHNTLLELYVRKSLDPEASRAASDSLHVR